MMFDLPVIKQRRKEFRSFKDYEFYNLNESDSYRLMPFRFHRISDSKELIINEVGDFLIAPTGTVERIVLRKLDRNVDSLLYEDLMSKFIIAEDSYSPLIDVLATRYRSKRQFLNYFTGLHIFVITLRCEHTCHYCQVSRVTENRDQYDMSIDHIDKSIDLMMQSPNPHLTMEFQGGEALLAFDRIKYAIGKAQELAPIYGKTMTYVICTNLAVITDEILVYCKDNNVLISTSLDGPKEVHDKNRHKPHASSYDLTVKGIQKVREALGPDNISALMTTSTLSLKYPIEIVDEYRKQGFNGVFLRNVSPYGFALRGKMNRYQTQDFLKFYKTAFDYIVDLNLKGEFFIEQFSAIVLQKILSPFGTGFVDLQSPAGLINGVIVYNYDGYVYATDESRMLAEMQDYKFRLGHVDSNSYSEIFYGAETRASAKTWFNESLAGCSDCGLQSICGSDPVHNWATQGDSYGYRPTSSYCNKNMEVIRFLFDKLSDNDEVANILHSWVRC